jgi:hypothetical protein
MSGSGKKNVAAMVAGARFRRFQSFKISQVSRFRRLRARAKAEATTPYSSSGGESEHYRPDCGTAREETDESRDSRM